MTAIATAVLLSYGPDCPRCLRVRCRQGVVEQCLFTGTTNIEVRRRDVVQRPVRRTFEHADALGADDVTLRQLVLVAAAAGGGGVFWRDIKLHPCGDPHADGVRGKPSLPQVVPAARVQLSLRREEGSCEGVGHNADNGVRDAVDIAGGRGDAHAHAKTELTAVPRAERQRTAAHRRAHNVVMPTADMGNVYTLKSARDRRVPLVAADAAVAQLPTGVLPPHKELPVAGDGRREVQSTFDAENLSSTEFLECVRGAAGTAASDTKFLQFVILIDDEELAAVPHRHPSGATHWQQLRRQRERRGVEAAQRDKTPTVRQTHSAFAPRHDTYAVLVRQRSEHGGVECSALLCPRHRRPDSGAIHRRREQHRLGATERR
eukprot:PhM_4_TR10100/c0_g1_i1/m.65691